MKEEKKLLIQLCFLYDLYPFQIIPDEKIAQIVTSSFWLEGRGEVTIFIHESKYHKIHPNEVTLI